VTDKATPTNDEPKRPIIAKTTSPPATGTDVVSVACKIPNGLILRAFQKVEKTESTPTGVRTYTQVEGIRGTEFAVAGPGQLNHQPARIVDFMGRNFPGGYAITKNVPKDIWTNWLKWNADTLLVKEGLVFAVPNPADAELEAKSNASITSGLEPIDPDHPERFVGSIQPGSTEQVA
jgi:hypothetical protein